MENHRHLPGVLTVTVIAVMIAASELFGEREIIFPEIAAIAVGMLLALRRPWQTSRARVLVLISLSAVVGLAVSVLLPLPLWEKMCVAFLLAQVLLIFGGTSFAPLISAAVLPVMLGTESLVYLIAAVSLTALILLVSFVLERLGLRAPEPYRPVHPPEGRGWARVLLRCLLGCVCIALAACSAKDWRDASLPAGKRAALLLKEMTLEEKIGQMCQYVGPCYVPPDQGSPY